MELTINGTAHELRWSLRAVRLIAERTGRNLLSGQNPMEDSGNMPAVLWALVNHRRDPQKPDGIAVSFEDVEDSLTLEDLTVFGQVAQGMVSAVIADGAETKEATSSEGDPGPLA
jgi:hypothetical protein